MKHGVVRIDLASRLVAPIMLLIFLGVVAFGVVAVTWGIQGMDAFIPGLFALVFGSLLSFAALLSVISGVPHMLVDVPAGVVHHVYDAQRTSVPLAELGPLAVHVRRGDYRPGQTPVYYRLEAAGLPKIVLVEYTSRSPAEKLRDRLDTLIAASAARRVLAATDAVDDAAYREPPDIALQLSNAIPDDAVRDRALAALGRDYDAAIRDKARALRR